MIKFEIRLSKTDIMIGRLLVFFYSGLGIAIVLMALGLTAGNHLVGIPGNDFIFSNAWFPLVFGCLIIPGAVAVGGINGAAVARMLGTVLYQFDERGVHVSTAYVNGRFDWPEVRRVYECKRLLVLSTPGSLQIIPKRFASSDSLDALKTLTRTNMKKR